jgi:hypothetical protein
VVGGAAIDLRTHERDEADTAAGDTLPPEAVS